MIVSCGVVSVHVHRTRYDSESLGSVIGWAKDEALRLASSDDGSVYDVILERIVQDGSGDVILDMRVRRLFGPCPK